MANRIDRETVAMLREAMARFRKDRYSFEARAEFLANASGFSAQAWRDYAEMGWLALPMEEGLGGFDGDPGAVAPLMEYVGASLALEPVLASSVLSGGALRHCDATGVNALKQAMASGESIVALAHGESAEPILPSRVDARLDDRRASGRKELVLHGDVADVFLVTLRDAATGRVVLARVDAGAAGLAVEAYRLVDGRGAANLVMDSVPVELLLEDAGSAIDQVLELGCLALCSEALGAIRVLNAMTNEYLKTRKQFGRPIGANQALQHRMVELLMLEIELESVIETALQAVGQDHMQQVRATSAAAAHAATAARTCAHEGVQLHGGIGMTMALPVSHYFKRLMVTARLLGDRDSHMRRFESAHRESN